MEDIAEAMLSDGLATRAGVDLLVSALNECTNDKQTLRA